MKILVSLIFTLIAYIGLSQVEKNMVLIKGGTYVSLYSLVTGKVTVGSFYMDKYPVTNADFELFIQKNPSWAKNNIKPIFADEKYLQHWTSPTKLAITKTPNLRSPVVNVSWFAAKKYCECLGKRLPTVDEWEYVALADETQKNASTNAGFYQKILDWYAQKSSKNIPAVGTNFKNVYGVYDIHGLIWEWNLDFISALSTKDSRDGNNLDKNEFCGAGSKGSKNPSNYAAFMRYAMRSSLKANYNIHNLGFRCVKDFNKQKK